MIDMLFVSKNCRDCAMIRAELDMNAVIEDDFRGKGGQEFHVYSGLSDSATRKLLDTFNMSEYFAPLLVPHDGSRPRVKAENIISWLKDNGMTK